MERWNLHRRIALYTIKVIGKNPSKIIFGFMAGTAFISMWVSNTAAAMMMIPIGMAVVAQVTGIFSKQLLDGTAGIQKENFGKSLMLAIAYSASIGGIATLTGTPPNAIMAGMISSTYNQTITFFQWFILAFPLALNIGSNTLVTFQVPLILISKCKSLSSNDIFSNVSNLQIPALLTRISIWS